MNLINRVRVQLIITGHDSNYPREVNFNVTI